MDPKDKEIADLKKSLNEARNGLQIVRMATKNTKGRDREGLVHVLININATAAIALDRSKA